MSLTCHLRVTYLSFSYWTSHLCLSLLGGRFDPKSVFLFLLQSRSLHLLSRFWSRSPSWYVFILFWISSFCIRSIDLRSSYGSIDVRLIRERSISSYDASEVVPWGSTQSCPSSPEFDSGVDDLASPKKYIVWSTHTDEHTRLAWVSCLHQNSI